MGRIVLTGGKIQMHNRLNLVYAHIKLNNPRVLHHNQHFIFSVSFYLSFFFLQSTQWTQLGGKQTKKKCKGTGARNLLQLDSRLEKKFNSGENTKSNLIPFTRKKK